MSNNVYWGEPTWTFFHTLIEKIKDEEYNTEKKHILQLIKNICNNLPCPDCKKHASKYLSKVTIRHVETQDMFKNLLFTFHNDVNKRTRTQVEQEQILDQYKEKILKDVFINFVRVFSKPVHNNRLMMDCMKRNILMKKIVSYIQDNFHKYN